MGSFIIDGGHRLSGEIKVQGAKNEALEVISAVLLTDKTVTRALAKTRRQRIIAAALWILSIVLSAALGVAFNWCI